MLKQLREVIMHLHTTTGNKGCTQHFSMRGMVARTINQGLSSAILAIDTPSQVDAGSREYHQAEALKAAQDVAIQFTSQAKKQAKRKCLGHLIASLSSSKEATSE